ncbi:hypothetical protein G3I78_47255, partial [Streptomyces sp. SID13726]|nr:hypothetical protein [Streptomyces sp. SID13726]
MNTTTTARQVPEAGSMDKPVRTRTFRAGLRLLIASAAVAELAIAAPTASAAPVRDDHAAAQRVLDRAVAGGGVPGILARIREDRDAWVGSAGVADTETGRRRR